MGEFGQIVHMTACAYSESNDGNESKTRAGNIATASAGCNVPHNSINSGKPWVSDERVWLHDWRSMQNAMHGAPSFPFIREKA
jgi:hypothetical protein